MNARGGLRKAIPLLAALAAGALIAVLAASLLGGEEKKDGKTGEGPKAGVLKGPAGDTFTMEHPRTWRALTAEELADLPGSPLAVLRRREGSDSIVIRRAGRARGDHARFARELSRELRKRVRDIERPRWRVVPIRAGEAFLFSYLRKRAGTVHSILIVPAGTQRSYAIDTASRASEPEVAREIGKMVVTFDVP